MGWSLFPCSRKTKAPLTPNGFKDASLDEAQIKRWLNQHPECAWGCPTSAERAVIDVDPRHGGDVVWQDLIAQHGDFPNTPKAITGGGGWHNYCQMPAGTRCGKPAKGVDLKADGGYVIIPPSQIDIPEHMGRKYSWEVKPWLVPIAEAPSWFVSLSGKSHTQNVIETADSPINPFIVRSADDLLTHPGSPEGERRKTLCILIGTHLVRGDSEASIRHMVKAWAERCNPYFDEWEKHLNGLLNKEAAKRLTTLPLSSLPIGFTPDAGSCGRKEESFTGHSHDTSFLPDNANEQSDSYLSSFLPLLPDEKREGLSSDTLTPDIEKAVQCSAFSSSRATGNKVLELADVTPLITSDDLPEAAYYGLFGEMLKAVESHTEAHPAGILLGWMTCFGNIVGRGACFTVGPRVHHPVLYVGIVGRTSDAKGDSWAASLWPFQQVEPDWAKHCIANGIGSGEGLIERIGDEQRFMSIKKGIAEETVIPGATDKRCLVRLSELSRCFKLNRRENATLSENIRDAWDGDSILVPNRKANALITTGYTFSIVGDITPGALQKILAIGTEGFDGFANRFLWTKVKSSRNIPNPANMDMLKQFLPKLSSALAFAKTAGEMKRDTEANVLWEEVYPSLKVSGDAVPHTDRARPYVMRLAMIFALADSSNVIRVEHLKAALAVWNYCRESAKLLFGETDENPANPNPLWLDVLNAIEANPGIQRSAITYEFRHKANSEQLGEALSWLNSQGKAYPIFEQTGGRKAECWFPGKKDDITISSDDEEHSGKMGRKEESSDEHDEGKDSSFLPKVPSEKKGREKVVVSISQRPIAPLQEGENMLPGVRGAL
jgi:hypothetical protein